MTAQDILHAMYAKYAAMRSYQDRGVVQLKFPNKPDANEVTFSTFYQRPDRFRFEWTTHHPYSELRHLLTHQVIWSNDTGSFLYSDQKPAIRKEESMMMAIAGASGVSKGAAYNVSRLLMADVGGFTPPQLGQLTLRHSECAGVLCYLIGGYNAEGDFCETYVGIDDLLMYRMTRRTDLPSHKGVEFDDIRREIRVDQSIDEQIFQFKLMP